MHELHMGRDSVRQRDGTERHRLARTVVDLHTVVKDLAWPEMPMSNGCDVARIVKHGLCLRCQNHCTPPERTDQHQQDDKAHDQETAPSTQVLAQGVTRAPDLLA
jgi:hypothetical protein